MLVRKYLFARGFRYRLNHPRLPGRPDIVLRRYRTVIFVNGCFWHGHEGCKAYVVPKSNVEFWKAKIERNRQRDKEQQRRLAEMGWHCITVWECQLKPKVRKRLSLMTLSVMGWIKNSCLLIRVDQKANWSIRVFIDCPFTGMIEFGISSRLFCDVQQSQVIEHHILGSLLNVFGLLCL